MKEDIERVLGKVRPLLRMDGGDVELVGVKDGVVKVKLTGACHGCPMSQMTLAHTIESALKKEISSVKKVESV